MKVGDMLLAVNTESFMKMTYDETMMPLGLCEYR